MPYFKQSFVTCRCAGQRSGIYSESRFVMARPAHADHERQSKQTDLPFTTNRQDGATSKTMEKQDNG